MREKLYMNRIERRYGNDNRKILCTIPPFLSKVESKSNFIFTSSKKNCLYSYFSIANFLDRYLAGHNCLTSLRAVSRKRLALINSEVGYIDPQAQELKIQIDRYKEARELLITKSQFSIELILKVNKLVEQNIKKGGQIRTKQNWIGGKSLVEAQYICPPPDYIDELLSDWIKFTNNKNIPTEELAIISHSQLLGIHPFRDGNGRTCRIILQAILERQHGDVVNPILYRLHTSNSAYINALNSNLTLDNLTPPLHPFWQESFTWSELTQGKIYAEVEKGKLQLDKLLCMKVLSKQATILKNYLWTQPIVCEYGLFKKFGWDINSSKQVINELVKNNILEIRYLRQPKRTVIYDCPIIFKTWKKIDDLIIPNPI